MKRQKKELHRRLYKLLGRGFSKDLHSSQTLNLQTLRTQIISLVKDFINPAMV